MNSIPRAVLEQEKAANEALEQDSRALDNGLVKMDERTETAQMPDRQLDATAVPDSQQAGFRLGQEAQDARQQTQDTARVDGGQKPDGEKTQEELAAEIKLERERNASILGRINSIIKPLDEESKRLRKRVEELENELAARTRNDPPDVKKLRDALPRDMPVDDDELAMIAGVVRQTVREELKGQLPETAKSLRNEIEAGTRAQSMQRFIESMERAYPGLVELDSRNDPAWAAFLNTPVKGTGGRFTYGHAAQAAMNDMDVKGLSEIVDEFSRQTGIRFVSRKGGMDERLASQAKPRQSGAATRQERGKPWFKRSQIRQFDNDLRSGRIYDELDDKAIAELRRDIEDAEADGRVMDD